MRLTYVLTLLAGLTCLPSAALAHEDPFDFGPKYYQVSGVEDGDTLNVRAEATAQSDTIGELAPGAGPLEVLSTKDDWGQIVTQERNGWVSLKFLKEVDVPLLGEGPLPIRLACHGTEPFWEVSFETQTHVKLMDVATDDVHVLKSVPTWGDALARLGIYTFVLSGENEDVGMIFVSRGQCSDGMSDAEYPYTADVSAMINGEELKRSGCCRLPLSR